MTAFIDSYDATKKEEQQKTQDKQKNIVQLLESISKALGAEKQTMSVDDQKKDLEDELRFKNSQLQNSETTQTRLEAELEKRHGELEKIETLDEKISGELMQLEQKIAQYNNDIATKFDLVEDMRAQKLQQISTLQI